MNHRRRPDPGLRPRCRFAAGWCRACGAAFVVDRQVQPWARPRTCSDSCRARAGNAGRTPETCAHCVMVEGYHDERCRQEIAWENGGFRDEDVVLVQFGEWLRAWAAERRAEQQVAA